MSSVLRSVSRRKKGRTLGPVEIIRREDYADLELDAKVELIRSLVPLGLMHVEELLDAEVTALAGGHYARKDASVGGRRHGSNPGTVGLAGQRVPIRVPRIRHVAGSEIPLRSYEALHGDRAVNDVLLKRVLYGISCRNYEAAAEAIPGAIGLSGSTVSRGFIQASAAKLRELQERDLSGEDVMAVVLDGKTFAEATMVIALGITIAGGKRFLGFVETDTENERVHSLYVILALFSRYVVGWMVARHENAHLAERLIAATCLKQGIAPQQLTIHADRGAPMRSKLVALLFSDLSINASHSRPRVSNDNPFSESQFRTLKYRPEFPDRFGSLEHARGVSRDLFAWYNNAHHHSGLSYLTPADVHYGRAATVLAVRHRTRLAAYAAHPERFVQGPPRPETLPTAAWINRPPKPTREDAPGATIVTPDDPQHGVATVNAESGCLNVVDTARSSQRHISVRSSSIPWCPCGSAHRVPRHPGDRRERSESCSTPPIAG